MNISRPTLVLIAGAIFMVVAVFAALRLAGGGASDETDTPSTAMSRADVERIIRNYLLENPKVIFEAVERFQQQENDQRVTQMKDKGKLHKAELFQEADAIIAGNPKGDVTIVEFFDYRCTYCRKVIADVSSLLKQDGNIKLVLKEFPILSAESELAARAAIAAHSQGKYWDFHVALMEAEELNEPSVFAIAKSVGLDVDRLKTDMKADAVGKRLLKVQSLARTLGIDATPTFFVGEEPFSGAQPLEALKDAVKKARQAQKS